MSSVVQTSFTREQLFAHLSQDGISGYSGRIHKAKNGDADSMNSIGYEYQTEKCQYNKAMAWYRIAAAKRSFKAQNNIGSLYANGLGVPLNYTFALEWYLKAVAQWNDTTCTNIGSFFEYGRGVPVNKYKALEWYHKSGRNRDKIRSLTEEGIQLTQKDKDKPLEDLIIESEDINWAARTKVAEELKEENKVLQKEVRALRVISDRKKEEYDSQRTSIEKHDLEIQTMNNEMQLLKQLMNRLELKLEAKDSKITLLESDLKKLRSSSDNRSQSTIKRIEELEKSNKSVRELLEKEKLIKINEIQLTKQTVGSLFATENQKKNILENETRTIESLDVGSSSNNNSIQENMDENNNNYNNTNNSYRGRGRGTWRGKSNGQGKSQGKGRSKNHNQKPI